MNLLALMTNIKFQPYNKNITDNSEDKKGMTNWFMLSPECSSKQKQACKLTTLKMPNIERAINNNKTQILILNNLI